MRKIDRQKWLDTGLQRLAKDGSPALRMELLCSQLGVTKGSFYHHFQHMGAYHLALLEYWEQGQPEAAIEWLRADLKTEERFSSSSDHKVRLVMGAEKAIRAWAHTFVPAKKSLQKVEKARLDALQAQYISKGLPTRKALDGARLEYLGLVGLPLLFPDLPKVELESLFKRMTE